MAVYAALENRVYLSPRVANSLKDRRSRRRSGDLLSDREQEVLILMAEGKNTKQISQCLKVSVKTVETHRASAMRKLGMSSTAELVRYAIRKKLVSL